MGGLLLLVQRGGDWALGGVAARPGPFSLYQKEKVDTSTEARADPII